MRKTILLAFLVFATVASAQRRRQKIVEPVFDTTPEEAMAVYDFDTAEEILEAQIDYLEKTEQSTDEKEALLEIVRKNMLKLHSTACITFIDSLTLPTEHIIKELRLGNESGTIELFDQYFNQEDTLFRTVFINQLQNRRIYARQDAEGRLQLCGQEKIGAEWTEEKPLEGLQTEENEMMNYPFMLSDGVTLYYAAKADDGLGGYDIYMTRYDIEDHTFLAPENVGMPFNSPANDYLLCIDEYNNLGWFVTDRNQPADSVCLYTFIPSVTRRVYTEESVGMLGLRNRARIHSIRDTWETRDEVALAQARLKELCENEEKAAKPHDFDFIVNDNRICTTADDFKNTQARQQIAFWMETQKDLQVGEAQLAELRQKYASASNDQKQQLAPQVRLLESKVEQLTEDLKQQAKQIRKLELGK